MNESHNTSEYAHSYIWYLAYDCPECGRHRVQGWKRKETFGVCEKCGYDTFAGEYASITRPSHWNGLKEGTP